MKDSTRIWATIAIWIIFASLAAIILTSTTGVIANSGPDTVGVIMFGLAAAVAVTSVSIWFGGQRQSEDVLSKAKRVHHTRVDRLIESLDDDEIYELEARLLAAREDVQRPSR
jgi:hypothetical protein